MESVAEKAEADWFEGPLGARVLREEAALAPLALDDVFGFELLQVGAWCPARHLLDSARTQHVTLLGQDTSPGVTLCAPLDSLPFRSDSIDAIFLPHTLELVEDPYAVLREAERVLDPAAPPVFRLNGAMCEPATHRRWAETVLERARLFGVRRPVLRDAAAAG